MPVEAIVDTAVEGVHVPKGSLVWCVMRYDSVNETHFPNAQTFEPERWLAQDVDKQASTPFGSGPRTCPGRYLALLEIKVAVAMLLSRFEIDSVDTADGQEPQELMAFVMSPVGLRMRLNLDKNRPLAQ
jgi:cytochrome P450